MLKDINTVLLSTQIALLGEVKPELRSVVINLDIEKDVFFIRLYHHGEISEKTLDDWLCVITEAFECALNLDANIIRLDYPIPIPSEGVLAYLRKETNIPKRVQKIKNTFKLPYKGEKYFLGNVKRAMQNALIGQITPNIREIAIEYLDNHMFVIFYYEGEIQEKDQLNMKEIMDFFCCSFSLYHIYLRYFRIDKSANFPPHQITVYRRYEEDQNNSPYYIPKNSLFNKMKFGK